VHGDVDAAVEQRLINLLGEQALAANVCQRLPQHLVPRGLDDHNLQRALLLQLREVVLQARERAVAGVRHTALSGGAATAQCAAVGPQLGTHPHTAPRPP
jgi:hypothetical protein